MADILAIDQAVVVETVGDVAGIDDVVVDPHRVDAELFGLDRQIHDRTDVVDAPVVRQHESEFHPASRIHERPAAKPPVNKTVPGTRLFING